MPEPPTPICREPPSADGALDDRVPPEDSRTREPAAGELVSRFLDASRVDPVRRRA